MARIKLTKNLYLDEYIDEGTYNHLKNKPHILLGLIDDRLIKADQMLRDYFGSVIINNWWSGGPRQWSGLRFSNSKYYSATSQHSYGRASDKIFNDADAKEVREYIKKNYEKLGITCIEDKVSWVHSDVRQLLYNTNKLLIVNP